MFELTYHPNIIIQYNTLMLLHNLLVVDKPEILDKLSLRTRVKDILLEKKAQIPQEMLSLLFSIIKNSFVANADSRIINFKYADVYLITMTEFYKLNLDDIEAKLPVFLDILDYIYFLSDSDEVQTYEILNKLNFFQVLLLHSGPMIYSICYRLYRILSNFCFSDKVLNDVTTY